ncbi:MAG: Histidine kinase [Segetibacter sp.]|nr:Histidine kinase [Segetibacter sp.]
MKPFWRYKLDHVLFWMITVLFYAYVRYDLVSRAGFAHYLLDIIIRNGLIAVACYVNISYLSPNYLKKGLYLRYVTFVLLCLLMVTAIKNVHDTWLYGFTRNNINNPGFLYNTYYNFSVAFFYVVFTMALDTSKQWFRQQVRLKRIETENLQTELRYLKAQMNPHFLFNSINTIYFQIDKKNIEARTSLQKFAELLRYQLYECNEDTIAIEKEVEYLRSYIDLQRLRKNNNHSIIFKAEEDVRGFALAPLLLLPFVENAFKHLSTFDDQPNQVNVSLYRQNGHFEFEVSNSKNNTGTAENYHGIGLKNVQRRLELLYANKYSLAIDNRDQYYVVNLKIQLQ